MTDPQQNNEKPFNLSGFFPYQVRIFYRDVSEAISDVYRDSHKLTIYEWRAMAVLGHNQPLSASEVVNQSSLDKVQISRAIKGLITLGYLIRIVDEKDRRRVNLYLTDKGNATFKELVPLVLKKEEELLSGLSDQEVATLKALMNKVRDNAREGREIENLTTS